MSDLLPTEDQAKQFATMLHTGLPASRAILYFLDTDSPQLATAQANLWVRSRPVQVATRELMKAKGLKPFHEMTLDERMRYALDLHYSQLATLLHLKNYIEADPQEKTKMDTARASLESKVAGTAGQGNPIEHFFADWKAGRLAGVAPLTMPERKDAKPS